MAIERTFDYENEPITQTNSRSPQASATTAVIASSFTFRYRPLPLVDLTKELLVHRFSLQLALTRIYSGAHLLIEREQMFDVIMFRGEADMA